MNYHELSLTCPVDWEEHTRLRIEKELKVASEVTLDRLPLPHGIVVVSAAHSVNVYCKRVCRVRLVLDVGLQRNQQNLQRM